MDFSRVKNFLAFSQREITRFIHFSRREYTKFLLFARPILAKYAEFLQRVYLKLKQHIQPLFAKFIQFTQPARQLVQRFLTKYIFKPRTDPCLGPYSVPYTGPYSGPYSGVIESKRIISKTIFRYVLMEALFSFFICFLFFFFIFFVNQILLMAKEVLTKHVPFNQVALLILYSLPTVIAMSAPFASLVGTLMTVGRLTSDNEILVMLSSGLSYKNIFFPAITAGILVSLLSFFTNDVLLPAGTVQFNKLWRKILVSTPALELEANSVKRFKDTVIVTGDVTENAINNVLILDKTSDGERRIILAATAELKDSGREGLSLDLDKAFVQSSKEIVREDYDYANTDYLQYWVSNDDIIQAVTSISPREMSSRDVRAAIKKRNEELALKENERKGKVASAALILENILRAGPSSESWNRKENSAANLLKETQALFSIRKDRSLTIHIIEYYKKFSTPFGAFFFVFLAVSLGLMAKKSGQTVGFIFGNIIAVIYWSMLFIGQTMGLRLGTPPFWSMWLPNILSLSIGVVLAIIRVRK